MPRKKKNNYCVYKHTNTYNGKIYVGITGGNVYKRWRDGLGYLEHKAFFKDIAYYGWINFKHEVLHEKLSSTVARLIETSLIKELDLTNPEKGYNVLIGTGVPTNPIDKCLRYKDYKPIIQIDPHQDVVIEEHSSVKDALNKLGIKGFYGAVIFQSLYDPSKIRLGYRWKYKTK